MKWQTKAGFSVIEVLVASSILMIITLGSMTMIEGQQRAIKLLEIKSESVEFTGQMRSLLAENEKCSMAFKDVPNLPAPTALADYIKKSAEVQGVPYKIAFNPKDITMHGNSLSNWNFQHFKGVDLTFLTTHMEGYSLYGNLELKFHYKDGIKAMLIRPQQLAFSLKVDDTGKIVSCPASGEGEKQRMTCTLNNKTVYLDGEVPSNCQLRTFTGTGCSLVENRRISVAISLGEEANYIKDLGKYRLYMGPGGDPVAPPGGKDHLDKSKYYSYSPVKFTKHKHYDDHHSADYGKCSHPGDCSAFYYDISYMAASGQCTWRCDKPEDKPLPTGCELE